MSTITGRDYFYSNPIEETLIYVGNVLRMHGNDPLICMIASSVAALCLDDEQNGHLAAIYARHAIQKPKGAAGSTAVAIELDELGLPLHG